LFKNILDIHDKIASIYALLIEYNLKAISNKQLCQASSEEFHILKQKISELQENNNEMKKDFKGCVDLDKMKEETKLIELEIKDQIKKLTDQSIELSEKRKKLDLKECQTILSYTERDIVELTSCKHKD